MKTRKIIKNNRGSYYLNLPKELVRELRWKDDQKVEVKKYGKKLVIIDWE